MMHQRTKFADLSDVRLVTGHFLILPHSARFNCGSRDLGSVKCSAYKENFILG
jgi:hypothetical protein